MAVRQRAAQVPVAAVGWACKGHSHFQLTKHGKPAAHCRPDVCGTYRRHITSTTPRAYKVVERERVRSSVFSLSPELYAVATTPCPQGMANISDVLVQGPGVASLSEPGRFYPLRAADVTQYFPEGLAGRLPWDLQLTTQKPGLMIRDPAIDLIVRMQAIERGEQGHNVYFLEGARGVGKSCTLNHLVHYARTHGWVVFFIPQGRRLLHYGQYTQPSEDFPGMFDLPVQAKTMLEHFRAAHEKQLGQIQVKDEAVLARHRSLGSAGSLTLLALVEAGIEDDQRASTVLHDVAVELKLATEFPVLIAVDEYNMWYQSSSWRWQEQRIQSTDLTIVKPFRTFRIAPGTQTDLSTDTADDGKSVPMGTRGLEIHGGPVNGLTVCAITGRYPIKHIPPHRILMTQLQTVGSPQVIKVEPYSEWEFESALGYYQVNSMLVGEATPVRRHMLKLQTDMVPELLQRNIMTTRPAFQSGLTPT